MSIDCPRIECKFHNDPRLAIGVETIVEHAAAHAGLAKRDQKSLAEATLTACRQGFCCRKRQPPDDLLRMTISSFPDRVEVSLEFPEEPPENGRETVPLQSKNPHPGVTLVQYREALKSKPRD